MVKRRFLNFARHAEPPLWNGGAPFAGAPLMDTEGTENTAFDWERYQIMKEGRSV